MSKNNSAFFKLKNSWSEIKDKLLENYLPQYFQKVLTTKKPIFYVDCFAGKGKFDDGKDGSPRIALKTIRESINKSNAINPRIDSCFIDLHYAEELQNNIAEYIDNNGNIEVISGKYEDKILNILEGKKNNNFFLYIDPYGIKALDYSLFSRFTDYTTSIEMLINMNSFGFMRSACCAMKASEYIIDESLDDLIEYEPTQIDSSLQSINMLNSIAGGDFWQDIVRDYNRKKINGYEAERLFSKEYKQQLRKKFTYVLDMPIRINNSKKHPKYRMIHITNHEDGCILMANNMFSRADELFIEVQNKGQLSLLDLDVQGHEVNQEDISKKLLCFLLTEKEITLNKLVAKFYTEYGVLCKSETIIGILRKLEKSDKIKVKRIPDKTPTGKQATYFSEARERRVTIIRNFE